MYWYMKSLFTCKSLHNVRRKIFPIAMAIISIGTHTRRQIQYQQDMMKLPTERAPIIINFHDLLNQFDEFPVVL